jgi:hypothetical protein
MIPPPGETRHSVLISSAWMSSRHRSLPEGSLFGPIGYGAVLASLGTRENSSGFGSVHATFQTLVVFAVAEVLRFNSVWSSQRFLKRPQIAHLQHPHLQYVRLEIMDSLQHTPRRGLPISDGEIAVSCSS